MTQMHEDTPGDGSTSGHQSPPGVSTSASSPPVGPTRRALRGPHVMAVSMSGDGEVRWRSEDATSRAGAGGEGPGADGDTPGDLLPEVVVVPVHRLDGAPVLLAGTPTTVRFGDQQVAVALDEDWAARHRFGGARGEVSVVGPVGSGRVELVLVGVGEEAQLDLDALRQLAASATRRVGRAVSVLVVVPASLVAAAGGAGAIGVDAELAAGRAGRALAEGSILGSYRFTAYKSAAVGHGGSDGSGAGDVRRVALAFAGDVPVDAAADGVRKGACLARATWFARDLVNEPPSSLTPSTLAHWVKSELDGSRGVEMEIWDEERITDERLGGLLGVARGSAEAPRLLWARYEPPEPVEVDGTVPHLVLVGKGITFDSGGLSLKTPGGMTTMKTDMSGAAAVLAAVSVCGELGVRIRVTAIAAVTENMPGGRAIKPGDVLRARNGKTIEVLNTDAEGRLVLADGLSLASELQPDAIVDVATLTGACVVALGGQIAGVMGNDDGLVARVRAAADRAGEQTWPLPLYDGYRSHIDSEIADMKNIGKNGQAGAIAAALLLANFVGDTPWAHLDIAGPARSEEDSGILAKGGTGFGVRTLVSLAELFAVPAEHYATTS